MSCTENNSSHQHNTLLGVFEHLKKHHKLLSNPSSRVIDLDKSGTELHVQAEISLLYKRYRVIHNLRLRQAGPHRLFAMWETEITHMDYSPVHARNHNLISSMQRYVQYVNHHLK